MKASIGDVALKAGVSNATVSRTFAHPEQVSEATRIKVQAAADALNFSISDRRESSNQDAPTVSHC